MSPSFRADEHPRPAVSAIVPVYNTDPVLVDRCLTSLLSQSYQGVDIVCVDDGSNADVARWLDAYCASLPNVRVVHQLNGGVASARNRGLSEAAGQFVCFVDADDFVFPDFIDHAHQVLLKKQADVAYGSIVIVHKDVNYRWRSIDDHGRDELTLSGPELAVARGLAVSDSPSPLADSQMLSVTNVVGALFRRDLAERIGFREGVSQAEDRLFNFEYLGASKRATFSATDWYAYDHTIPSSATKTVASTGAERLLPTIRALADLYCRLERNSRSDSRALRSSVAEGLLKYLKLLVSLTAGGSVTSAARTIHAALQVTGVSAALVLAPPGGAHDRAFLFVARRRHARALALLGRLAALRARRRI